MGLTSHFDSQIPKFSLHYTPFGGILIADNKTRV